MKLVRFGSAGAEKPGIVDKDSIIRDLSSVIDDISGETLSPEGLERLRSLELDRLPIADGGVRLGPCVCGVGKFICIGLNFREHVKEAGVDIPSEPVVFMKATSSIAGPNDPVVIPAGSQRTDWEVELGVVIGRAGRYISRGDAPSHIAGYCVVNDVSERAHQLEGTGQWVKGKSADSFGPIGPWLVTSDEVGNPQDLEMWLSVNGRLFQQGNTCDMIFDVHYLVSYLSGFMSLQPGDIISTGTPVGVGMGQTPPRFLRPGDRMSLGIDRLGEQFQQVIPYAAAAKDNV